MFAGRRGRLLAALLLAEFGAAVQAIAFASVLPIASGELEGDRLYGAALGAGSLTTILVMGIGLGRLARVAAGRMLALATAVSVVGVGITAGAPSMPWVVAGEVVRGSGTGLMAGFGLTAVGALYESRIRPRVLGLFALVWFIPSLLGPVINGLIDDLFGWRATHGWPALIIVAARLLMGRHLDLVPWTRSTDGSVDLRSGGGLGVGLVLAGVAPLAAPALGWVLLVTATAVTLGTLWRVLARRVPGAGRRRELGVFLALAAAYFGGTGLVPLGVVEGLGRGLSAGGWAVGVGSAAWALAGVRVPTAGTPSVHVGRGVRMVAIGLVVVAVALYLGGTSGFVTVLVGSVIAGTGMGVAYPHLTSRPMDGLEQTDIAAVAVALTLTESVGAAIGAAFTGGAYGLVASVGGGVQPVVLWASIAFAVLLFGITAVRSGVGSLR